MKRAAAHLDAGAGCRLSLTESERTAGIWELGTAFQWQIVGLRAAFGYPIRCTCTPYCATR